jgi:hypothetical protein
VGVRLSCPRTAEQGICGIADPPDDLQELFEQVADHDEALTKLSATVLSVADDINATEDDADAPEGRAQGNPRACRTALRARRVLKIIERMKPRQKQAEKELHSAESRVRWVRGAQEEGQLTLRGGGRIAASPASAGSRETRASRLLGSRFWRSVPGEVRPAPAVPGGVAPGGLGASCALEVQADVVLVGDADAAMHLDALGAREQIGLARDRLR